MMDRSQLGPEFQSPEFLAVLLAILDIAEGDVRRAEEFRGRNDRGLTLVGWTILMHVFVVEAAHERGTRAQVLVDTLPVPRRTIRDTLRRLALDGWVVQDAGGYFYATPAAAKLMAEQMAGARLRQVRRICDAFDAFSRT